MNIYIIFCELVNSTWMYFIIYILTMKSILINVLTNSTHSKNFLMKKYIIKWKELENKNLQIWLARKACIAGYVALNSSSN
jgi:hypothetical protein